MLRVRAGRVHPVTAPPIEDGAVLVDVAGRIAAVGPNSGVPLPPGAATLEYPEDVLVPGLVNCHTHLELTHLAGRSPSAGDFAAWIRDVRARKDETAPETFAAAAERGVRDAWARGVTCVADTGSTGATAEALARLRGRGIVYQEVFGPDPAQCAASMSELARAVERLQPLVADRLRLGVSPHAPYTVSASLYRAVAEYARRLRLPLALHLAESPAETEFVRDGTGPFAEAHRQRGIPVVAHGVSPVRYLLDHGVLELATGRGPGALQCIHCVQVDENDIRAMKLAGVAVAVCPRSNVAHGHGVAPFARLRSADVAIGLGTDSVASVPDLDLWAEAGAIELSGEDALRMLTLEGARALGWESEIGSLEPGKAADLAVFAADVLDRPLPPLTAPYRPVPPPTATAPYRPLPPTTAILTVIAGRIVYRVV